MRGCLDFSTHNAVRLPGNSIVNNSLNPVIIELWKDFSWGGVKKMEKQVICVTSQTLLFWINQLLNWISPTYSPGREICSILKGFECWRVFTWCSLTIHMIIHVHFTECTVYTCSYSQDMWRTCEGHVLEQHLIFLKLTFGSPYGVACMNCCINSHIQERICYRNVCQVKPNFTLNLFCLCKLLPSFFLVV